MTDIRLSCAIHLWIYLICNTFYRKEISANAVQQHCLRFNIKITKQSANAEVGEHFSRLQALASSHNDHVILMTWAKVRHKKSI